MAGKELEVSTPLLENILHQPQALQQIAEYQFGQASEVLDRSASLLKSKSRIVLSGMGASYFACIPFQYMLSERGLQATVADTAELLYFLPSLIGPDTVVLLVSRSGESVEVVKLIPVLRERGASIIGIVNVPGSTLGSSSDTTITMNCPADQMVAIQTYTGTVEVLALLAAAVSGELAQAEAELDATAEILSSWIPECVVASETWRPFLEGDAPLYLLGRGPSLGAVSEGVLLMHETAKASAVGMQAGQFRHGPVEVVDSRFRAIIFGTQAATAELDGGLAEDLTRMEAHVRWVGRATREHQVVPLCVWPEDLPARFTPIAEVIPLQLASYRRAELRGIRPGDFRWAPLVTTSESGFTFAESALNRT
jgi:glucosamine--fructose-6-phosphate aminotransferase (isomerizing)